MLEYSNTFSFLVPSECNQHTILNDSDRHSDFGRGDRKCDNHLTEDWYRFSAGAGTSIPTHCLPHHRCGTDLPGWMDGAHPTVDEGVVSRKVCFSGFGKCCYNHIMINVRNCGSFFVYRLKPWSVVVCLTCCWTNSGIASTSRMKLNFKTVRPFKELSFRILKEAWSRLCRIIRVKFMRDAILSAGIIYIYFSFFNVILSACFVLALISYFSRL